MSDPDPPSTARRLPALLSGVFLLTAASVSGQPAVGDPALAPALFPVIPAGALVAAAAVLLSLSAFFSASETALFSLTRFDLHRLQRNRKATRAERAIVDLVSSSKETLTTILIGNMAVNIATSLVVGGLVERWTGRSVVLSLVVGTIATTLCLLILGEIFPKSIALERASVVARLVARPLVLLRTLTMPLRLVFLGIGNVIFKILRLPPESARAVVTEQEIKALITQGHIEGVIEKDEREMIDGVFEFNDLAVDQIMTPRVNLQAYPDTHTRRELEAAVRSDSHSRVFIYHDTIDHVTGVVHVKDLLLRADRDLRDLVRKPMFVPPKMRAARLLNEFRRHRQHVALVLDEYGGTAGCITMNDLLEQIVGDILEAGDSKAPICRKVGEGIYEVEGLGEIEGINEALGTSLPIDEANTISGLIMNSLGAFPRVGDEVEVGGLRLRVSRMAARHVAKALLALPPRARASSANHEKVTTGGAVPSA